MKKYSPKVTIVIPAYNASNYLKQAIDSALAQTYRNVEIIVVNDGSSDEGMTEAVANEYQGRIRYFSKENGGSSSALNMGIKNMQGEWFSWLSHDDLYYPSKIEEQINYINELLIKGIKEESLYKHIFFGAANLIDSKGKIIRKETKKNIKKTSLKINGNDGALKLVAIPTQDGFHGCSCLVHRLAFQEIGLFNESLRLLNDMDLWFRFYTNNYQVHFIPKVLVCGRVHAKQVSRSVGFSYHNAEQDMFWRRSLEWLKKNQSENYELFYLFGKTAYLKTRNIEGMEALNIAKRIQPNKAFIINVKKIGLYFYANMRDFAKKIYLKIHR